MRIAQVAPLYESVPPKYYGGTERVVSYLTEELVRQGHDVTLFAAGGSLTNARLEAVGEGGLRLDPNCRDPIAPHVVLLDRVARKANRFDVVHFHTDYLHFPVARLVGLPHVTTLHGRLDIPDLQPLFREFCDVPVVSISNQQRTPIPFANWIGTVYHGLPTELYPFRRGRGDYLAFMGRVHHEKRLDRAIEIARRAGKRLRIAAKVDRADTKYFEQEIKPLLKQPDIEFVGEIGDKDKAAFLGNAQALLFPIDWPEPFGLVMIEAMACGTPVVAWRNGSVPEIIADGKTGFVVDSIDEAVEAVAQLDSIDPRHCRNVFEERFSARRMARDYLALYQAAQSPSTIKQSVA